MWSVSQNILSYYTLPSCDEWERFVLTTELSNLSIQFFHFFKLKAIGDRSAWHGPRSHSEKPVGTGVLHTGPTPMDRFSCGESGLHCT